MKYVFPAGYGVECRLVEIDASFVPIFAGLLTELAEPGRWATDEDYGLAYNAITEMVASMACSNSITQLTHSIDRLYMLMDGIYNGRAYVEVNGEPPALPVVPPPPAIEDLPGLRRQLLEAQGEIPGGFLGLFPRPVTQADIFLALRQGSEEDVELLDGIVGTLDAADDASDIFNTIRGLITSAGSLSVEGATLATIVAASMANAAMLGLQGAQLDAVNTTLSDISAKLAPVVPVDPADTVVNVLVEIADRQGAPADTDCELSTNEALCEILTALTSETELGEPPASCPGFPPHGGVWLNISTWIEGQSPGGPADDWRGEFTANGQPASLYIDVLQPYPLNPEITWQVLRTTADATNVCISWDVHPVGASILVDYWEYSTNEAGGQTTLDSSGNPPNPGSHPIVFDSDQGLIFSVNTVGSTEQPPQPTVNLWIVRGATG